MAKNKKASLVRYKPDKNSAPVYLGTGVGAFAERIIEIAREHDVPVIENEELSRSLESLPTGVEIPETLFLAVAEILAFCMNLKEK